MIEWMKNNKLQVAAGLTAATAMVGYAIDFLGALSTFLAVIGAVIVGGMQPKADQ